MEYTEVEKRIPILWVLDKIDQTKMTTMIQKSFSTIPFKAYFVTIVKSNDLYLNNYIDTLFFTAVKKSFIIHVPNYTSLEDCLAVGENFVEKCAPYYIFVRDCVLIDKDLFLKTAKQFYEDKKNSVYALKEVDEDKKTIFDPSVDRLGKASYLLSKVRLSKLPKLDRVDLGAITTETVTTCNGPDVEDFVDPRRLNYERAY